VSQKLPPLRPPDSHHLSAAVGWLELGNHLEANEELEKVTPQLRVHPDVLKVRWSIYAKAEKWTACIDIASSIKRLSPNDSFGWIHDSFALHELKRTQEAYDNLIPVVDNFPNEWLMHYNLACYAAQLGNVEEAANWLTKAMGMGDEGRIKRMAIDDPDLEPIWAGISEI
jgi:tetratricopeptide (TPR) repeat protein